jgi:hypothetical protein
MREGPGMASRVVAPRRGPGRAGNAGSTGGGSTGGGSVGGSPTLRDFPAPNTLRGMVPPNSFAADRARATGMTPDRNAGGGRQGPGGVAGVAAPGPSITARTIRVVLYAIVILIVALVVIALLGVQP